MPDDLPRLLSILSDQPAYDDRLNFAPYAKTLADILADPDTDTPLTIGVFGGWGQGKTSLMNMVQRRLEDTLQTKFPVRSVWFNAWLYSHQQSLWRALISRVLSGARGFATLSADAQAQLNRLEARLYQSSTPTAGQLTLPAGTLTGLDAVALPPLMGLELLRRQSERGGQDAEARRLAELIADVEQSEADTRRDQIAALDDFRREFENVSRKCIVDHGRLAVFVDDLDRCLPDQAVEVLEAVKLFLDVPGCVFVLGIARDVIEEGIRVRYKDYATQLDGAQYLEKIIQIPFALPPIAPESVQTYVQGVTGGALPDARCEKVFAIGLEPNPRRIKRTLNIFLLLWRLAQNREDLRDAIRPVRLAKIVIVQQYYPRLFELITQGPHYLIDLEARFREQERPERATVDSPSPARRERGPGGEGGSEGEVTAGPLTEFLGKSLLRALLTCTGADEADANFADVGPVGVREYVYLTRSTVEEAPKVEAAALPFEPQMVTIPAGKFLLGTSENELKEITKLHKGRDYQGGIKRELPQHEVTLAAYAIGRYPVTNAEFRRFAEDGGYTSREHWTEAGWQAKESNGWKQPRYWDDNQWNDPSQPVVGVAWYEAAAYCNWLAHKTGKPYRLPTEAEWEHAARGKEGYRYPWGDAWDKARCNNKESGPGRTTPVGQYPSGDSSFGVGDMVGQVWEWCSSKYGGIDLKPKFGDPYRSDDGREDLEGDDTRILRGGSWYDDLPAAYCRCGYRFRLDPDIRYNYRGFRCARTL